MVRLRLKRMGNRHRPFYRLTAIDQRKQRDGRFVEELGTFNPLLKDEGKQIQLDLPRVAYWLSVGAQPSRTVAGLIRRAGLKPQPGTAIDQQPAEAQAQPVAAEASA